MPRLAIKIRRLHEDGSECTHTMTPSGKPREGEDCPGPKGGYDATCNSCPWTTDGFLRTIVEDAVRIHRDAHRSGKVTAANDGGTQ
jgi:hypothetical protein